MMAGQQPIIVLREGTKRETGKGAQSNNIQAARAISESVKSTLGPKGMDKMLVDSMGDVVVTNDGATILKEIDVEHPAAKMIVEVAKSQDEECGDGTTSAVILAGALLENAESLLDQDVHPTIIVDGYRKAAKKAKQFLESIADSISSNDKTILNKIAKTSMQTKLVRKDSTQAEKITETIAGIDLNLTTWAVVSIQERIFEIEGKKWSTKAIMNLHDIFWTKSNFLSLQTVGT